MTYIVRFILITLLICAAARAQTQPRPASSSQIQTVSGSGNTLVTTTGPATAGHCVTIDANGNHVDAGSATACGPAGATGPAGAAAIPIFVSSQNLVTDVVCAKGSDTIASLTCNNSTDGTSTTPFNSSVVIPAGTLSSTTVPIVVGMGSTTSASSPGFTLQIKLGSTVIYQNVVSFSASSLTLQSFLLNCGITAVGAASTTTRIIANCTAAAARNAISPFAVTVDATVAQTLTVTGLWASNLAGNAWFVYSLSAW
jgi:hypothetical protein